VRECAIVTVQLRDSSSCAIGLPTMLERPTTTASSPSSFRSNASQALSDQDHGASRRAGNQRPAEFARRQATYVDGMKTVDILVRSDRLQHPPRMNRSGQRQLDEDPVDRGIGVELPHQREQLRLIGRFRQIELQE